MKKEQGRMREQLSALKEQVEANERNQRQLNLRIYGFDAKNTGAGPHPYKHPKEVWLQLLRDGLQLPDDVAKNIGLAQCHWAGKGAFLIVRFLRHEDRSRVLSQRKKLGTAYKPHGRIISLVDDRTKEQSGLFHEAGKVCRSLTAKGHRAFNVNGKIKIGTKLYAHDDPFIIDLL
jgi:hypothetical protein